MKRFVTCLTTFIRRPCGGVRILVFIVLTGSLCILAVFAETTAEPSRILPVLKQATDIAGIDPNTIITAKPETEVDILADPNKIESAIKEFEGLDKELAEVKRKSGDEIRQWFDKEPDNKTNLAKAAHENVTEEIMFIRKLAVEEGAKKTTAAIDGLLLSRQERYDRLIIRLQEEEKKELRRTRTTRDRYRPGQRYPQERRTRGQRPEEDAGQK